MLIKKYSLNLQKFSGTRRYEPDVWFSPRRGNEFYAFLSLGDNHTSGSYLLVYLSGDEDEF